MNSLTHLLQPSQFAVGFVDLLLKSLVILLVAGAICLCWRRSAASARHLVWFFALAGLLCLPALCLVLPAWQRPLWKVGTHTSSGNEVTLTLEVAPAQPNTIPGHTVEGAASSLSNPTNGKPGTAGRLLAHFHAGWAAWALSAWTIGAGSILVWIAAGWIRLDSLRRSTTPPPDPQWLSLLSRLCHELGIRRRVTLLQSADDLMPVTWGWWRPVILLPAEADAWSPERRRVVLLHELGHVKRWDCLTQSIARLACAFYWFNPLAWVAARRMCIERERACDSLVLNGGCKASDYATHLVEIARSFRRLPQVAAIAMARSTQLEGRIAAIVDGSRSHRGPRALLIAVCGVALLALVAAVAAQKPEAGSSGPPWYDARLRAFFAAKEIQAHQLAALTNEPVAPEVWPYFAAGIRGDWQTATNLWVTMRHHAHQYEGTTPDARLDKVWSTILETDLAWENFANWTEKYVLAYGNDIIKSIPEGSIYFGGTDPGRGVITAMCESHADAKPFFTLTQNALADGTYLDYLRAMYGQRIYTPTAEDSQKCFSEYTADAQQRLADKKLKPGESVKMVDGKVEVSGQVAVMGINGLLTKIIFDRNPTREFYVEESFPLDWMYPHLSPNGLIMKVNREPLAEVSDEMVQEDQAYWSNYLRPMLGDWLDAETSVSDIGVVAEKIYLRHDTAGFTGDPQFLEDTWAQKAYSKLRSSMAGVYAWRVKNAKTPEEKQRMSSAADFAFRQAWALCPTSPEAVFRYVNLLVDLKRLDDALVVAETSFRLDPKNEQIKSLIDNLKSFQAKR